VADPASEKLHFRYQIRRSGAPFAGDSVALRATKSLAGCARAFAGIWTAWHGTRGPASASIEGEVFGFLTTEANFVVAPIHAKAMPVILTTLGARAATAFGRNAPDRRCASQTSRPQTKA